MFEDVMQYIINNLLIPIAFIFVGSICVWAKNKISEYLSKMNDNKDKELSSILVTNALMQLDQIISSVVAKNQILADEFKKANVDGKLTQDEISKLQTIAMNSIKSLLPLTITSDEIIKLLGGQDIIDKLIADGIEKALINLKKK